MITIDLRGKTILITGALGAIAEYIIKSLHEAGASLVLTDRTSEQDALPTLEKWGVVHAEYYRMDVCDPDGVESVISRIFTDHPHVNIALGHAGGTGVCSFEACPTEQFDQLVRFNFLAQTYFSRSVLKQWRQKETRGHLIFTSSYVSRLPRAGISAYVASKAALEMFAKNLALEMADYGIRVNCIAPGNVEVGSSKVVYDNDPVYRSWVDRYSPLRKQNSPESIANAFLYLCSSLGDELDGHVLQVDQGIGLPKMA